MMSPKTQKRIVVAIAVLIGVAMVLSLIVAPSTTI
ncbi:hypothetical protein BH20ACT8_BH20ACT8_19740 [soil metagenome]|jgi:thiamine transporter ThiT